MENNKDTVVSAQGAATPPKEGVVKKKHKKTLTFAYDLMLIF